MDAKKKSEIVKLNVGGRKYTTTRSTLEKCGESFFTQMLANDDTRHIPCEKDEEGYIFIDRNGETFTEVLDYMRSGEILVETAIKRRKVDVEIDFFLGRSAEESSSEIPRAGEKFFAVCKKNEEKVVKEIDRNAKAIEKSIQDALAKGHVKWQIHGTGQKWVDNWNRVSSKSTFEIKINPKKEAPVQIMIRELANRWGLKPEKYVHYNIIFDLSHFMGFSDDDTFVSPRK